MVHTRTPCYFKTPHTHTHIDITHAPIYRYATHICKSKVPLCTTLRYVGSGGVAPFILNLGPRPLQPYLLGEMRGSH